MNAAVREKQEELIEKQHDVKEVQQEIKQECHKESIEQSQEDNVLMQQVSRASIIIGTAVKNYREENLGDIKDLVLDPKSGQVVYAVVSFGGVFGLGDKLFAVPWKALHWTDEKYYFLEVDKNTLEKAPGFDKNHWPDSSSKWEQHREELDQFYHIDS